MANTQNDVLSWTSQDPRQSQLFNPWGIVYRIQVYIIGIAMPDDPDSTFPDRDQRTGPEHDHCLAFDTCEQRGSSGQARVGPGWWSRTRRHREGQAFAPKNFPFDVFLTLSLDHRTNSLWLTWSGETQECLCVSRLVSADFHLTWINPELESIQWPRWFPVPMETEYYKSGYCGGSPKKLIHEGRLIICYPPQLQDPNNNVIAFVRPTRPTRYQGIGDVYAELHFVRAAGHGMVVCPAHISNHQRR